MAWWPQPPPHPPGNESESCAFPLAKVVPCLAHGALVQCATHTMVQALLYAPLGKPCFLASLWASNCSLHIHKVGFYSYFLGSPRAVRRFTNIIVSPSGSSGLSEEQEIVTASRMCPLTQRAGLWDGGHTLFKVTQIHTGSQLGSVPDYWDQQGREPGLGGLALSGHWNCVAITQTQELNNLWA